MGETPHVDTVRAGSRQKMSDGDKLRLLAQWFDHYDEQNGGSANEVQNDLRRIAGILDALQATDQ